MGKILVITEKPSVGMEMAKQLKCKFRKDGYIEGNKYIMTWAVGHLVGLKYPEEHDSRFKKWSLEDLPLCFNISNSLKILPGTEKQFQVIKKLINSNEVDSIINAGDAGREGYLIQSWIYRMAGNKKPVKVLWASSFTEEAVKEALDNLKDDSLFAGLLQEAEARAEADHFVGINYSRALGIINNRRLAYGRCQTPLLKLIVDRDRDIASFVSKPYYNVQIVAKTDVCSIKAMLVTEERKRADLEDLEMAQKVVNLCKEERGTVLNVTETEKVEYPPLLYNLSALQKEMGRKYGYTPDKTLQLAQVLYEEKKVLSYPRTESQYLSTDLYHVISKHINICCFGKYATWVNEIDLNTMVADKRYFNNHKVTDHYALIPTINADMDKIYAELTEEEKNVFNAVITRFLSIFLPPFKYKEQEILINVHNFLYLSKNRSVVDKGYRKIISADNDNGNDGSMQSVVNGEKINVETIELLQKKTEPPKHFTVETLIAAMEKYGIGTAATRADIIKKLQNPDRKFVSMVKKNYISTELGQQFIDTIPDKLKGTNLTQSFEERLSSINAGKMGKDEFLKNLSDEFVVNLAELRGSGNTIVKVEESEIGMCPLCGHPMREGEKNYFCSNYKNGCKYSIGKVILGKPLSKKQINQLLNGRTQKIKGFISKKGTAFDAALELDAEKKIKFVFES